MFGQIHTVDSLLIGERLSLLCLVPVNYQTVPEGESCAGVCSPGISQLGRQFVPQEGAYRASQLNNDRARVVSMCLTTSVFGGVSGCMPTQQWIRTSNSSLVLKPVADLMPWSISLKAYRKLRSSSYKFAPSAIPSVELRAITAELHTLRADVLEYWTRCS